MTCEVKDTHNRFSKRVESYIKYRPSYPKDAVDFIVKEFGVTKKSVIADIGSGTGIFTKLLADYPETIYAVEPNLEMRLACESSLCDSQAFISIDGSAESTKLESNSVNLITVAQAFHWFDLEKAKREFIRILKSEGKVLLIWNRRKSDTDFLVEYDSILKKYANDYNEVNHKNIDDIVLKDFFNNGFQKKKFTNSQNFDYQSLLGRLLSSSYSPLPGDEKYQIIEFKLEELFNEHNRDGLVDFNYETEIIWGQL